MLFIGNQWGPLTSAQDTTTSTSSTEVLKTTPSLHSAAPIHDVLNFSRAAAVARPALPILNSKRVHSDTHVSIVFACSSRPALRTPNPCVRCSHPRLLYLAHLTLSTADRNSVASSYPDDTSSRTTAWYHLPRTNQLRRHSSLALPRKRIVSTINHLLLKPNRVSPHLFHILLASKFICLSRLLYSRYTGSSSYIDSFTLREGQGFPERYY